MRERIALENEARKFGRGWMPDEDGILKGNSNVQLKVVDGGPDHVQKTLLLSCNVKPGIDYPFAGAMYSPGVALETWHPVDYSGIKSISFWTRGDGHKYYACMFNASRGLIPAKQGFVAGKDWELHTIPISAFGTNGHDITLISFVATPEPGKYQFELAGLTLGSGSWLGVHFVRLPVIPGSSGRFATEQLVVSKLENDSPAARAGLELNDRVIGFSNEKTTDPSRIAGILAGLDPGTTVPIQVVRGGQERVLEVRLEKHPDRVPGR